MMCSEKDDLLTLDDIQSAYSILKRCPVDIYHRTPLIVADNMFNSKDGTRLYLKLENMQVTGSFKVRGTYTQLCHLPTGYGTDDNRIVSMSAGNYGKAFAYLAEKMKLRGTILMPDSAPRSRETLIQSYGIDVERLPTAELMSGIDKHCRGNNTLFLHPFDDMHLIAGHGTIGLEILEEVHDPDIVLVCCGGGGLLAGVASAIKLSGHNNCRIYGVEPEGSCTMYESLIAGHPVTRAVQSIAAGLSPPFAGQNCYRHCRQHVEGILLVSDLEILTSMMLLYSAGLVVEPSGAAAFAALQHSKVPDVQGKKIIIIITGGNVSPEELSKHSETFEHYHKSTT